MAAAQAGDANSGGFGYPQQIIEADIIDESCETGRSLETIAILQDTQSAINFSAMKPLREDVEEEGVEGLHINESPPSLDSVKVFVQETGQFTTDMFKSNLMVEASRDESKHLRTDES